MTYRNNSNRGPGQRLVIACIFCLLGACSTSSGGQPTGSSATGGSSSGAAGSQQTGAPGGSGLSSVGGTGDVTSEGGSSGGGTTGAGAISGGGGSGADSGSSGGSGLESGGGSDGSGPGGSGVGGHGSGGSAPGAAGNQGNPGTGGHGDSNCNLPATVSFQKDVQPFLITSCGGSNGCHVIDAMSTMGSGGYNHAYDWITAGAHTTSCPETPTPERFQVVIAVIDAADPATCSKSRKMPPPDATGAGVRTPLTTCQIATLQAWLDEPLVTQMHRADDSSPKTPYPMPPFN